MHASKLLVSRRLCLLLGLAAIAGAPACYRVFEPDCGFVCGPSNACPADYTCAADDHCHRNGTPSDLVCGIDAAIDAPPPDAAIDARPDAMVDAP